MGNNLTTAQPLTLQDIINEVSGFGEVESEFFGSRLFKIAKVIRKDEKLSSFLLVKMFKNADKSVFLEPYKEIMERYCKPIRVGFNLIPPNLISFKNIDNSVTFIRDFVEQSLLKRIHTRPFLSHIEKQWISYQLLKSLEQLHGTKSLMVIGEVTHNQPLCHGDIKAENILITDWGWVLLADPSPFKPVFLPADNPTMFTFFFDNSRRRACYLAPERLQKELDRKLEETERAYDVMDEIQEDQDGNQSFLDSKQSENESLSYLLSSDRNPKKEFMLLTPSMDLFSMGCVILEIFTDGTIPFTLSDILLYCNGDNSRLERLFQKLPDESFKSLLMSLLDRDPNNRKSATEHLEEQKAGAFPELFYGEFSAFMQSFLLEDKNDPNVRLRSLKQSLPSLFEVILKSTEEHEQAALLILNIVSSALRPNYFGEPRPSSTPITSATVDVGFASRQSGMDFRNTRFEFDKTIPLLSETAKIDAISNFLVLSKYLRVEFLIDRVTPYLFDLALAGQDDFSSIRGNSKPRRTYLNSIEVRNLAIDAIADVLIKCISFLENLKSIEFKELSQKNQNSISTLLDITFLTDYLMPNFQTLFAEEDILIQLSLTRLLPVIVEFALNLKTRTRKISSEKLGRLANYVEFGNNLDDCNEGEFGELEKQIREVFVKYFDGHEVSDLDSRPETSKPHNLIRQTLIDSGNLAKFAALFGQSSTISTIISYIITVLNNKNAHQLRTAFYQQISSLLAYAGLQSIAFVQPLIEEGLVDANDAVLESCLRLVAKMQSNLLSGPISVDLLKKVFPLTIHPTARIRQAAVAFLTTFARTCINNELPENTSANSNSLEVQNFVACRSASVYARFASREVRPFFRRPIVHQLTNDEFIMANLQPFLSKNFIHDVFQLCFRVAQTTLDDTSLSYLANNSYIYTHHPIQIKTRNLLENLIQYLRKRTETTTHFDANNEQLSANSDNEICKIFKNIQAIDGKEIREIQLVAFHPILINMLNCWFVEKSQLSDEPSQLNSPDLVGFMINNCLTKRNFTKVKHKLGTHQDSAVIDFLLQNLRNKFLSGNLTLPLCRFPNFPCHMDFFGRLFTLEEATDSSTITHSRTLKNLEVDDINNAVLGWDSLNWKHLKEENRPESIQGFSGRSKFLDIAENSIHISSIYPKSKFSSPEFRELNTSDGSLIKGHLVVHLHEHDFGFLSLATHLEGNLLASASNGDGTVKFWDCGWPKRSVESQSKDLNSQTTQELPDTTCARHLPINSSHTYIASKNLKNLNSINKVSCRGLSVTAFGKGFATLVSEQEIHVIDVNTGCKRDIVSLENDRFGKAYLLTSPYVTSNEAAYIGASSGGQGGCKDVSGSTNWNLLAYVTASSHIVGCDLRISPKSSTRPFCLKQENEYGIIRCLALHSAHSWLVSGSNNGYMFNWDLRFQRPVSYTVHPNKRLGAMVAIKIYEADLNETNLYSQLSTSTSGLVIDKSCDIHTLLLTAHERHNEISVWDMKKCTFSLVMESAFAPHVLPNRLSEDRLAVAWSTPMNNNCQAKSPQIKCNSCDTKSTKAMLCLPPRSSGRLGSGSFMPALFAGGMDGRIRLWDFGRPSNSSLITFQGLEEHLPPGIEYKCINQGGITYVLEEIILERKSSGMPSDYSTTIPPAPVSMTPGNITKAISKWASNQPESSYTNRRVEESVSYGGRPSVHPRGEALYLRPPTQGHVNTITDLTWAYAGQPYLVSGSIDGVIKFWI